jgi:8-oxo-dGTP diphosphatase
MNHFHIAIALVWRDDKILVTQRRPDADHLPDLWEFPGGKCHANETPEHCAIREVAEETGLPVRVTTPRTAITYDYPERSVTLHPFDCEVTDDTQAQPLECAAVRWLLPADLHIDEFPSANIGLIEEIKAEHGAK